MSNKESKDGQIEGISGVGVFRDKVDMTKPLSDFVWFTNDEPHASRRKAMLAKYPQIRDLYGFDPQTKWYVVASVVIQLITAFIMARYNVSWPVLVLFAWVWGGTINHSLMLANHELSHDLLFPTYWQNRLFSLVPNTSLAVPMAEMFRKYHMVHHRYQGLDAVDPDLPTYLEGNVFRSTFGKFIFIFFQSLFYSFRPLLAYPVKTTGWEIINTLSVITTDFLVLHFFGFRALVYLLLSSVLGSGIHPLAAHFVAEHYAWTPGFETFSYYGILNFLVYNVGYHNEHHDFPRIPGSRLPRLHKIAPEFYADGQIGKLDSWVGVIWRFIFDPAITPYSRIKRKAVKYAPDLTE
jgi:sphingolipid delta-4 desaturase